MDQLTSGGASATVDPVTVQVIRNKVASLVDEMHYHFYRSNPAFIIPTLVHMLTTVDRQGRSGDKACVIIG